MTIACKFDRLVESVMGNIKDDNDVMIVISADSSGEWELDDDSFSSPDVTVDDIRGIVFPAKMTKHQLDLITKFNLDEVQKEWEKYAQGDASDASFDESFIFDLENAKKNQAAVQEHGGLAPGIEVEFSKIGHPGIFGGSSAYAVGMVIWNLIGAEVLLRQNGVDSPKINNLIDAFKPNQRILDKLDEKS